MKYLCMKNRFWNVIIICEKKIDDLIKFHPLLAEWTFWDSRFLLENMLWAQTFFLCVLFEFNLCLNFLYTREFWPCVTLTFQLPKKALPFLYNFHSLCSINLKVRLDVLIFFKVIRFESVEGWMENESFVFFVPLRT